MKTKTFLALSMFYFAGFANAAVLIAFWSNDSAFFWLDFFLMIGAVFAGFAGLPKEFFEAKEAAK